MKKCSLIKLLSEFLKLEVVVSSEADRVPETDVKLALRNLYVNILSLAPCALVRKVTQMSNEAYLRRNSISYTRIETNLHLVNVAENI